MRLVHIAKDGAVELNWMWLPTFIGQNYMVLRELQKVWMEKFRNAPKTEATLDIIHDFTIGWLFEKFPMPGLDKYLKAIENVRESAEPAQQAVEN